MFFSSVMDRMNSSAQVHVVSFHVQTLNERSVGMFHPHRGSLVNIHSPEKSHRNPMTEPPTLGFCHTGGRSHQEHHLTQRKSLIHSQKSLLIAFLFWGVNGAVLKKGEWKKERMKNKTNELYLCYCGPQEFSNQGRK